MEENTIREENMIVIRDPKRFFKDLKHEIEFIIKSNESLVDTKINSEIEQIFLKYNPRSSIYKQGKQQNE